MQNASKLMSLLGVLLLSSTGCLAQPDTSPWLTEMKCESKNLGFSDLSLTYSVRGNSVFGPPAKNLKSSWESSGKKSYADVIFFSDDTKVLLRMDKLPDSFISDMGRMSEMPLPNPLSIAETVSHLPDLLSSKATGEKIGYSIGFSPAWLMDKSSVETSGDDEKKRLVMEFRGHKEDDTPFLLSCAGVMSVFPSDMNPINPDLDVSGFTVFEPPAKGGARLGKIHDVRLSEWEEMVR